MRFSLFPPTYNKILNLAVPVIVAQIGQVTVNLADNAMVGHVGTTELAASSFAFNVFLIGMLFGLGITYGLTPLVGHSLGEKNNLNIAEWLKNGLFVHVSSSVIICMIMSSAVFFMHKMGQPDDVVKLAKPYYILLVFSLFPLMIFFSLRQFFEGIGNTKISMVITIVSNITNIALNYVLIFGKLGFPALGLFGAGIATLISRIIMPILFVVVVLNIPKFKTFIVSFNSTKLNRAKILKLISVGLPIGIQLVIEVLSFSLGAIMIGWISKESLAGHQVAIGMASMTYMISLGLASGTTIIVSHSVGNRNTIELKQTIKASLIMVVSFMSLMGILFIALRDYLPWLFTSDLGVIKVASGLLIVGAFFQVFDGIQVVMLGALRGMADVKIPAFLAFFSYIVVSLPISYLLSFVFSFGASGVWIGLVFGLFTASILFGVRTRFLIRLLDKKNMGMVY